jgi:hypothetical protein
MLENKPYAAMVGDRKVKSYTFANYHRTAESRTSIYRWETVVIPTVQIFVPDLALGWGGTPGLTPDYFVSVQR